MLSSLRFALRSVIRTPGFSLLVALCLALGIGVNVAFLGVLDVLLRRPPAGVRDPRSLYRVEIARDTSRRISFGLQLSRGDAARLAARRETFARIAVHSGADRLSLGTGMEAREISAGLVDSAYFGVVGVPAVLGRLIGAADEAAGAPGVVVLSERLWRAAYGADRAVLGTRVKISGQDFTVIGVAGGGFSGVEAAAVDAWLPLSAASLSGMPKEFTDDPETRWLSVLARLAPSTSEARATAIATTVMRAAPPTKNRLVATGAPRTAALSAVASRFGGEGAMRQRSPVPVWLLGATAAVLLVACANVANLLLARGEWRRREIATRVAIGASRGALVRQLLMESAVLAAMGAVGGLVLAQLGTRAFAQLPNMPELARVVDLHIAGATVLVTALTTLLCGLVPALRGTRVDPARALRAGARATSGRSRLRGALMAGQLAAALALLVTAGVFVRSLRALRSIDAGMDLTHSVVVRVSLERAGMAPAERADFAAKATERVRKLPHVAGAARALMAPFGGVMATKLSVDGVELPSSAGDMQFMNEVGEGYFAAIGLPIRAGRAFTAADAAKGAPSTLIVSASFARAAWKGADPVGRCVRMMDGCATVIGVAADVPFLGLRDSNPMLVYGPLGAADNTEELLLMVRAKGDPADAAREVRAAVQGMDPRLPYVAASALVDGPSLRGEFAPFRLGATAFSIFGALALLVAAVGLYAVVAYSVVRRTGEIGVRVALGATSASIRELVVGEGLRHALLGIVAGCALGAAATHALRAKLYGVQPLDIPTFVVVTLVLLATALLASWLPARRAAAIPPTEALRSE